MPSQNRSLKPDSNASQDLSTGALSHTTAYGRRWRCEGVYVKASVSITETVTVTLDSVDGANYDSVLATVDFKNASLSECVEWFKKQGIPMEMNAAL